MNNIYNSERTTAVWQNWQFRTSHDSFEIKQTLVLQMNFGAENAHYAKLPTLYI